MGTRNLTAVYLDGEYRVAQYGQWDGYPNGAGITVLEFMRDKVDMERFKTALRNSRYISAWKLDDLWRRYGADENGCVTMEQANAMVCDYPQFSRDTGCDILELVQNHPDGIELQNDISFAANSLFCEWAWVVDLDAGTLEAYEGFNQSPLTEEDRFYFLRDKEEGDYHGVKLAAKWNLDALPGTEDFLAAFSYERNFWPDGRSFHL